jgi:hypothetical protein
MQSVWEEKGYGAGVNPFYPLKREARNVRVRTFLRFLASRFVGLLRGQRPGDLVDVCFAVGCVELQLIVQSYRATF